MQLQKHPQPKHSNINIAWFIRLQLIILLMLLTPLPAWSAKISHTAKAIANNWQREKVNWQLGSKHRIKAIYYPQNKTVPLYEHGNKGVIEETTTTTQPTQPESLTSQTQQVLTLTIDNPPVNGFVPWIAVAVTSDDRRGALGFDAVPRYNLSGAALPAAQSQYCIGLFDTGAGAHVIGHINTINQGITNNYLTGNTTIIGGATNSVTVNITKPLGLFIAGLGALDPNGAHIDTSKLVGESGVALASGLTPASGAPDLPTAIGTPLSVFYATSIHNDHQITVTTQTGQYTAPDINIYPPDSTNIEHYPNIIPLELRPLGATNVGYTYGLDDNFDLQPTSPSIIMGNSAQSLFFVSSVDLYKADKEAYDKSRFIIDTGAQVTVIGKRIAARLALDIYNPDFQVEIQDVTGTSTMLDGFYIDRLDIPALGNWLSFTHVPVILLDVNSPEGGTLDGIIGMNLFTSLNMVIRGGGMAGTADPSLEFAPIANHIAGDIAPAGGDGSVNIIDLVTLAQVWLSNTQSGNWNPNYDIAPAPNGDGIIDLFDFATLAQHWLDSTNN